MKVKITYQKGEPIQNLLEALMPFIRTCPGWTWRHSERHAPFYHVYLTFTAPGKTGEYRPKKPPDIEDSKTTP